MAGSFLCNSFRLLLNILYSKASKANVFTGRRVSTIKYPGPACSNSNRNFPIRNYLTYWFWWGVSHETFRRSPGKRCGKQSKTFYSATCQRHRPCTVGQLVAWPFQGLGRWHWNRQLRCGDAVSIPHLQTSLSIWDLGKVIESMWGRHVCSFASLLMVVRAMVIANYWVAIVIVS